VTIVFNSAVDAQSWIAQTVAVYKSRFRQQAVGVIVRPDCVSF
jgi:hypothetical protein